MSGFPALQRTPLPLSFSNCWTMLAGELDIMEVEGSNFPPKHSYYTSSLHVGKPGCCEHTCDLSDRAVVMANYGPVDLYDGALMLAMLGRIILSSTCPIRPDLWSRC